MKRITIFFSLLMFALAAFAQIENPVKWSFSSRALADNKAELIFRADIQPGWHVYSLFLEDGGPIPTTINFSPSGDYSLVGKPTETPKATSSFDENFKMQIAFHEKQVVFKQQIKLNKAAVVKGSVDFTVCNAEKCVPEQVEFSIPVSYAGRSTSAATQPVSIVDSNASVPIPDKLRVTTVTPPGMGKMQNIKTATEIPVKKQNDVSLLGVFVAGFLGGLLAFFMPCIYPMIPLTVSFFTKRAGSKAKGIRSAIVYGLSIIIIYVALGLVITILFGASALNEAASSATFNLIFFAVLVLFAISFLGAFEITLPSSLVNKMDEKSNRGGLGGLFFMAFTLALVSFSCTGPIIGTLLVETVSKGAYLGPAMGMLGFAAALAIPFTLFAIFPSWLKELPKSGGWMNAVKVSLGFLELALAFKFLSNVDLAYHWNFLSRDIFLVIWITIFGTWSLYLFGKFKLAHDVEVGFISITRLFFAMLILGFTLYMIPGLFGAPLKALSAWLPPQGTQEFDLYSKSSHTDASQIPRKYADKFPTTHGLDLFFDLEDGLSHAKSVNKPVLIDFTGWTCTNCRKMEGSVWSDPEVLKRLRNDYVIVSLYVDDRTELHENEKYVSETGKKIKTLGNKWSDFQTRKYQTNSQPYYVIANAEGKTLVPPQAFNLDINNYINFLESGKTAFSKQP